MNPIRRAVAEVVSWFRPRFGENFRFLEAGQLTDTGPEFGVEIFNDNETPMEFVVEVLQSEFDMKRDSAVKVMLHIHHKGSVLLPVDSLALAEHRANEITARARDSGHPLVCRAASAQRDRS